MNHTWKCSLPPLCTQAIRTLLSLALLVACTDVVPPTDPRTGRPSFAISDAVHGRGKPHFYFLPPIVAAPAYSGEFDAALSVAMEICPLTLAGCGAPIARFTMASGPGSEMVRLDTDGEVYAVNWHTDEFALDPAITYRIRVLVGDFELGFADVDILSPGKELRNVVTGEYIPLLDGRTLPIKVRIEEGVVAAVTVTPAEVRLQPGATPQFAVALTDLHGATISGPAAPMVVWTSSDESVLTMDQTGLATAVASGEAKITATAAGVSGSASVSVTSPMSGLVVAAGISHSCALKVGQAYCWGLNSGGELGDGTNTGRATAMPVLGGLTFVSIDVGAVQSCGVTSEAKAYCWGHNFFGHLGDGTTTNRNLPVPVSGGLTFTSVNAGYQTCGVTTGGDAYCWGNNSDGQLGDGTFTTRTAPVLVSGALTFSSVSTGFSHTCGITNVGKAYCWGRGDLVGDGTSSSTIRRTVPLPVSGGLTFSSVSANDGHTCGLTIGGQAYCWGFNGAGQLGDGTVNYRAAPVAVSGGLTFSSVTMGRAHACGLTNRGEAYCWGSNSFGELGDGTSVAHRTVPARAAVGLTLTSLSAGYFVTCGVTTDNQAYCWGSNRFGVLGDGTFNSSSVPVAVVLP